MKVTRLAASHSGVVLRRCLPARSPLSLAIHPDGCNAGWQAFLRSGSPAVVLSCLAMIPFAALTGRKLYRPSACGQSRRLVSLSSRVAACDQGSRMPPPIAEERSHTVQFGHVEGENRGANPIATPISRDDTLYWLRDDTRTDERVLSHLRAENAYMEQQTAHLKGLRETIYAEHIAHMKETEEGPPVRHGPWFYYTRTVKGLSYKFHCRKPAGASGEQRKPDVSAREEILLDENKVAEGKSQCVIQGVKVCPDHTILAYSVDFTGSETYEVHFVNLSNGEKLVDTLEGVCNGVQWGADSNQVFYITENDAKRPWKLWRHTMGTPQSSDQCLLTEEDELFGVDIGKSTSGRFLIVLSQSSETSEVHVVDLLAGSAGALTLVQSRRFGLLYDVEHIKDSFLITTNKDDAINNKLMRVPVNTVLAGDGGETAWVEILAHSPAMRLDAVVAFKDFVAIAGREEGLSRVWVMDGSLVPETMRRVQFEEELCDVGIGTNKEQDTPYLRIEYSSLTTPRTAYDYDFRAPTDASLKLVWRQEVPNFDPSRYICRRIFAKAPDGTEIPISIVHLNSLSNEAETESGPKPCMLYGYGSYGICLDPHFDVHILPYLDRGMVYCIAHIRGGGEMGRYWYEQQGKYLNKRNTFSDFIACAEHLIEQGVTSPQKLAIEGRSAGGLLMGAVLNMRPDLFRIAVAGVPFVDVMNTMSDPSIPLTTGEWEEWGNPNEWKYFDYMLSYSPYDNVRRMPYPNILITAGLHDPRVAYWEPAKWASKLRVHNTNPESDVIVKMDLEVGHFSASDRYRYKREKAFDQAVVLDKLGLAPREELD